MSVIPAVAAPGALKVPAVQERLLSNGLRVLAVRRASVPVVELRLRIPTSAADPKTVAAKSGRDRAAATLLAETMLTGTETHDRSGLATELQALGAGLSANIDNDRLALVGSVLAPNLKQLLALLAEVIHTASYPKREVSGSATASSTSSPSRGASRRCSPVRRCSPGCTASTRTPSSPVTGSARGHHGQAAADSARAGGVAQGCGADAGGRPAPGRRTGCRRGGARRLVGTGGQGHAQAAQAHARRGDDRRPARSGADQHPPRGPDPAAHGAQLRGAAGRQRRVRRLLLLAAGQQHPRGQGLHVFAPQLHRARRGGVTAHRRG